MSERERDKGERKDGGMTRQRGMKPERGIGGKVGDDGGEVGWDPTCSAPIQGV